MDAARLHGSPEIAPQHRDLAAGVWRIVDPRITLASVASMIVGAAAAAHAGRLDGSWLALTVLGIFCVEAAKNASGEIFDWDSGTDQAVRDDERTPFSGGKRVLVDGLLTRRQTVVTARVFYALGAGAGIAIATLREPRVAWLGVLGLGLAWFYHAPPLKLSYRGLGELAVAVSYGPVIAAGTYLVQRHSVDGVVLWPSLPLGLAIAAFLWINEMPDARADASAGKRTLVVRLGRRRSAAGFAVLCAVAHASVLVLPAAGLPAATLLGLAGAPLAVAASRRVLAHPETPAELVPAQGWTLLAFLLMAVGIGAGLVLGA